MPERKLQSVKSASEAGVGGARRTGKRPALRSGRGGRQGPWWLLGWLHC